jgi:hypothetical protein
MYEQQELSAKEWIETALRYDRCAWCGRDVEKKCRGFCRHCNEVRKDLGRLEMRAIESPRGSDSNSMFKLRWDLDIAKQKKNDCILWGELLRRILVGPVDSHDLEVWFCQVAKRIARDGNMHDGTASRLGQTFTVNQRRVLGYMFWEIFGAEASHTRQSRAQRRAHLERLGNEGMQTEDEQTQRERA